MEIVSRFGLGNRETVTNDIKIGRISNKNLVLDLDVALGLDSQGLMRLALFLHSATWWFTKVSDTWKTLEICIARDQLSFLC